MTPVAGDERCPTCGYALAGLAIAVTGGPCPECGGPIRSAVDRRLARRGAHSLAILGLGMLAWGLPLCAVVALLSITVYLWLAAASDNGSFQQVIHHPTAVLSAVPAALIAGGTVVLACSTPSAGRWLRRTAISAAVLLAVATATLMAFRYATVWVRGGWPGTPFLMSLGLLSIVPKWTLDVLMPVYAGVLLALLGAASEGAGLERLARFCRRGAVVATLALAALFAAHGALRMAIDHRQTVAAAATAGSPSAIPFGGQPPPSVLNEEVRAWFEAVAVVALVLTGASITCVALTLRARLRYALCGEHEGAALR